MARGFNGHQYPNPANANSKLVLLSTIIASGAATVDIERTLDSTYSEYVLEIVAMTSSIGTALPSVRMKIGGSYLTAANYAYHSRANAANAATYFATASGGGTDIPLAGSSAMSVATDRTLSLSMRIHAPSSSTAAKQINWAGSIINAANVLTEIGGAGAYIGLTDPLTGIRIYPNGGGTISGEFRLYGIANS